MHFYYQLKRTCFFRAAYMITVYRSAMYVSCMRFLFLCIKRPMAGLVESLIRAYRNEKCTKEILPYEKRVMAFLEKNLPKQIEYAASIKKKPALKGIYEQEIERVKYFMKEYIITRMKKISQNLNVDETMLSSFEIEYRNAMYSIYKQEDVFVPCKWINNEFVGFVSIVDNNHVVLDGNPVEMRQGDFFVGQLRDAIEMLYKHSIYLV